MGCMEEKDRRWMERRKRQTRIKEGHCMLLTKGRNDGTCDAVGHTDCKDTHGPGVLQAKLELVGLTLQIKKHKRNEIFYLKTEQRHENKISMKDSANPLDMDALSLGLGEAEAEGIHRQCRDAKQLHRRANQTGCNHIVYKECAVVRKKHAPATRKP